MRFALILAVLAAAGCADSTNELDPPFSLSDAGTRRDSGATVPDANAPDSGAIFFDAQPADASQTSDAGAPSDAGLGCSTPPAQSVAVASRTIFALLEDGTLWSWGDRIASGLVYNGSCCQATPAQVAPGRTFRAIAAGDSHACATDRNGQLWCWGTNRYGQIGTSTTSGLESEPIQVGIDADWSLIAAGSRHSCGIKSGGQLFCWGSNEEGQLGLGEDRAPRSTPTPVAPNDRWLGLGLGSFDTCAIRFDRTLWCWGYNAIGGLGVGDNVPRRVPEQVGRLQNWSAVEMGGGHTLALNEAARLFVWGRNYDGELGLGDDRNRYQPVAGDPNHLWTQITAGAQHHSCGLTPDGELFCWGSNTDGQLGSGDFMERRSPERVPGRWSSIATAWGNSCAIDELQRVWCWGSAEQLALGPNWFEDQPSPLLMCW